MNEYTFTCNLEALLKEYQNVSIIVGTYTRVDITYHGPYNFTYRVGCHTFSATSVYEILLRYRGKNVVIS